MIGQVVVKLNRACNLACDYCYYINDTTPNYGLRMPIGRLANFLDEYAAYCACQSKKGFVVLHGGEPLLMGVEYIQKVLDHPAVVSGQLKIQIQTNGTLLNDEWISLFLKHNVRVGISLDGPRDIHDKGRKSRNGKGSYEQVIDGIQLLIRRQCPFGVLTVISPEADGGEVFRHHVDLGIKGMDFLLPISNHALAQQNAIDHHGITRFLLQVFNAWYDLDDSRVVVRIFNELIDRFAGRWNPFNPIGSNRWEDLVTLETDGQICSHEDLIYVDRATTGRSYYHTSLNIDTCSMREAEEAMVALWSSLGSNRLPTDCLSCEVNHMCHGGHVGSRYGIDGSFDHRSLHCPTLYLVSKTIRAVLGKLGFAEAINHMETGVDPRLATVQKDLGVMETSTFLSQNGDDVDGNKLYCICPSAPVRPLDCSYKSLEPDQRPADGKSAW